MLEPIKKDQVAQQVLDMFRSNSEDGIIVCIPSRLIQSAHLTKNREQFIYQYLKKLRLLVPVIPGRGNRAITLLVNMDSSVEEAKAKEPKKPAINEKLQKKKEILESSIAMREKELAKLIDDLKLVNEQIESLTY